MTGLCERLTGRLGGGRVLLTHSSSIHRAGFKVGEERAPDTKAFNPPEPVERNFELAYVAAELARAKNNYEK